MSDEESTEVEMVEVSLPLPSIRPMDRRILRAELEAVADSEDRLDPHAVVAAARDPNSALHRYFTWDDTEAANKWRLSQAGHLIRRVQITVEYREFTLKAPVYVRDPDADGAGYVTVARLISEPERALAALKLELRQIVGWCERAEHLGAVLGLQTVVATVTQRARKVQAKIERTIAA